MSASSPLPLPDSPSLEWLRKAAKRRLAELRRSDPAAQLAQAQFALAEDYGFPSWRALKQHIDTLTVDGQLFDAARRGDVPRLADLLDQHPEKLTARAKPYEWTLLHLAAEHIEAVDLLLRRGIDVNARERGDHTFAMHWAAAAGRLDVVRRLEEASGDVIGAGDDHELEVIGWATCWDGGDDAAHRAVADFLVSRGARHHIFSAIALNLEDEVRRIVAENPRALSRRMSHNEDHQLPLHFAVGRNRPAMVELLMSLGADPLGVDESGFAAPAYAESPDVDRPVLAAIAAMAAAELDSADRGHRRPHIRMMGFLALLGLGEWQQAERLWNDPELRKNYHGVLHLMAKRGDLVAVRWLLERGADPSALWAHWDADVTPLHCAALGGHLEVARALLEAGADPHIKDSKHDSDALGWAEFFRNEDLVRLLRSGPGSKGQSTLTP